MENKIKFIIGGVLITFLLTIGNWLLYPLKDLATPIFQKIIMTAIFLAILLYGLDLIAESLIK
jgi:hypothetical protein